MSAIARGQITISNLINTYTFIRYSNDGVNFTAASADAIQEAANAPMEGRNLVLNGGTEKSSNSLIVGRYSISKNEGVELSNGCGYLVTGKTYTLTIDITPVSEAWYYELSFENNNKGITIIRYDKTSNRQTITKSFVMVSYDNDISSNNSLADIIINRWCDSGVITGNTIIHSIKIEEGTTPTAWSPAPEDLTAGTTVGAYLGTLVWNKPYASWLFSDYKWSLTKGQQGDTGNGISKVENFYLASSSNSGITVSTSGWSTTIPTLTQTLKYLWNYEKITYTDSTSVSTTPRIISGPNAHIDHVTEYYNITNDPNNSAGPGWSTTMYTISATQRYLWNKELIVYVDGSNTFTDPHVIAVYGDTGTKGDKGDTGEELSSGKPLFTDPEFRVGFDSVSAYNNAGDGTVTVTRIARNSDNPTTSGYELQIQNTGSTSSPYLGGCLQIVAARANATFVQKIIAKIPVGYTLNAHWNDLGNGYSATWLTPHVGTGRYATYLLKIVCGSFGGFATFGLGFLSLSGSPAGTPSTPVTWYIAYLNTFDMTATDIYDAVVSLSPSSVTLNADEDNKINGLANGSLGITSNIICMKGGNAIGYSYGTPTFSNCLGSVTTGLITINAIDTEVLTDKDINGAAITRYKSHASMMVPITPYGGTTQNVTFDVFVNQQGYIIKKVRGDIEEEYHIKQVIDGTTVTSLQGAFTKSATEASTVMDQKVAAIQIGGRNLLLNSANPIFSPNNTGLGTSVLMTDETDKYYRATPGTGKAVSLYGGGFTYSNLQKYCTGMYVRQNSGSPLLVTLYCDQNININTSISIPSGIWTYMTVDPFTGAGLHKDIILIADVADVPLDYKKVKIETGTKPTDWTPAPEDVEADYNSKFTQTATNITAEVNARTSANQSLQSQITANAEGITQRVSQTDYNANNAAISTHFSQIEQTANNINLSVYQNRSIGKNVLLQTDFDGKALTDLTKWTIPSQDVAIIQNAYNGKAAMRLLYGSFIYALKQTISFVNITPGSTYLFSFYAKKNDSAASMEVKLISASKVGYAATFDGSATGVTVGSSGDVTVSLNGLDNDFVRHTLAFTANPDATSADNMTLRLYCNGGTYVDVCMLQLESTELTGWGPSPQDTQNNIDKASADTMYNFNQAGINITADGIVANSEKFFIGNATNGTVFSVLGNSVGINGFLNTAVEEVTFPTVATDNNRYFVDDKMNIFVRLDASTSYKKVIYLPNDYDYIGAHIIIVASPFLNDTGALVPYANLPFLEIRTGRNYMRHTYLDTNSGNGTSSSPWGIPTDTAGEASVSTNLAIQANAYPACVYSFIGKIYSGNAADVIQLKNGYIELLGVPSFIKKPVCPLQLALNDTDKRHTVSNSDFVFGADDPTYSLSSSLKARYGIESSGGYYYDKNGVATECASGILKAPFCQWVILGANAYSTNYITD